MCLALEGGPPGFPQDCSCLVVLRILALLRSVSLRDSHPLWSRFPTYSNTTASLFAGPTTPTVPKDRWFGLFPVRSPLLRESRLISFSRATEMFQFTHVPPSPPMCSVGGLQTSLWRSCLIRNLGVLRLYAAPPERFAGLRVLLRSYAPRHPPRTLCSLFFFSRASLTSCLVSLPAVSPV